MAVLVPLVGLLTPCIGVALVKATAISPAMVVRLRIIESPPAYRPTDA
jgi:hypothetical protein